MKLNKEDQNNSYNELSIIINQQSILSQKVGILLAINTLMIGFIIGLAYWISWWVLIGALPSIISLVICVYILFPNFSSSNNSKYFYDFANMEENEIIVCLKDDSNTIQQIIINSKILKEKYELFKHSLAITFIFIPYIFLIKKKRK